MKPSNEPPLEMKFIRGEQWVKWDVGAEWIQLGIAPRPQNQWQTFVYHVCHGLIMRYPFFDVLRWSWKNRTSFTRNS